MKMNYIQLPRNPAPELAKWVHIFLKYLQCTYALLTFCTFCSRPTLFFSRLLQHCTALSKLRALYFQHQVPARVVYIDLDPKPKSLVAPDVRLSHFRLKGKEQDQ